MDPDRGDRTERVRIHLQSRDVTKGSEWGRAEERWTKKTTLRPSYTPQGSEPQHLLELDYSGPIGSFKGSSTDFCRTRLVGTPDRSTRGTTPPERVVKRGRPVFRLDLWDFRCALGFLGREEMVTLFDDSLDRLLTFILIPVRPYVDRTSTRSRPGPLSRVTGLVEGGGRSPSS